MVGLLPLVLVGGARGWRWVRHRGLRFTHLGLMLFITGQAWLGQLCPLTVWEQDLRRLAGQSAYGESFIEHWLARLLYWGRALVGVCRGIHRVCWVGGGRLVVGED